MGGGGGGMPGSYRELSGVMETVYWWGEGGFVTWIYEFAKTHQTVYLRAWISNYANFASTKKQKETIL